MIGTSLLLEPDLGNENLVKVFYFIIILSVSFPRKIVKLNYSTVVAVAGAVQSEIHL